MLEYIHLISLLLPVCLRIPLHVLLFVVEEMTDITLEMSEEDHHVFLLVTNLDVSEERKLHVVGCDMDLSCFVELHEGLDLHLYVLFLLLETFHRLVVETQRRAAGYVGQTVDFWVGGDHCSV